MFSPFVLHYTHCILLRKTLELLQKNSELHLTYALINYCNSIRTEFSMSKII